MERTLALAGHLARMCPPAVRQCASASAVRWFWSGRLGGCNVSLLEFGVVVGAGEGPR